MGVKLSRSYTSFCADANCSITGYALIRMVPPTGFDGVIYNTQTGKSYPKNHTCVATIGEEEADTWVSPELPFSDHLSPNVYYEVVEVLAGESNDLSQASDCDCGSCGTNLCSEPPPTCSVFLSSTGSLVPANSGHNDLNGLCVNAPMNTRDEYFAEVFGGAIKPIQNVELALMYLQSTPESMPWYAPRNGTFKINSIATIVGSGTHDADLYFEVYSVPGNTVLYGDFLSVGAEYKSINSADISIAAGTGIAVRLVGPLPTLATLPLGISLQLEYTG